MKAVLVLLTIAVTCVCGKRIEKLREIKVDLDNVMKNLNETNTTYVMELANSPGHCDPDYFFKVEKVLAGNMNIHKLSNTHLENLIRRLQAYNKNPVKPSTVDSTGQQISLHQFLGDLKKCIQKNISQHK